jgi:hypothetical protein
MMRGGSETEKKTKSRFAQDNIVENVSIGYHSGRSEAI